MWSHVNSLAGDDVLDELAQPALLRASAHGAYQWQFAAMIARIVEEDLTLLLTRSRSKQHADPFPFVSPRTPSLSDERDIHCAD